MIFIYLFYLNVNKSDLKMFKDNFNKEMEKLIEFMLCFP